MPEREYYPINETGARTAKELMSFSEYVEGSKTAECRSYADQAYDLAEAIAQERPREAERAWRIATAYSRRMAKYFNDDIRIGCMCPSVMISGGSNFPVKKKQRQVAAWESNMERYNENQKLLTKLNNIRHGAEVIRSDDEDAITRLEEKLESLEEAQATMKEVNVYYRKNGTLDGCEGISDKSRTRIETAFARGWYNVPYPPYALQNNNQEIRRIRDRLESLRAAKSRETSETDYSDYGFTFEENVEDMRFRFYFDGKPDEETRSLLKGAAFKWSQKNGCWQRQITDNARRATERLIEKLTTQEG